MTAFMINANGGPDLECEVVCEKDESVFLALTFDRASGQNEFEAQATEEADIEEFFRLVDKAKADYQRLTGKTLP